MPIQADFVSTSPGQLVDLFTIDISPILAGATPLTYTNGVDSNEQSIVFAGVTYTAIPVSLSGLEKRGDGTAPRPRFTVGNPGGIVSALCVTYQDLIGAKVSRKRTFGKYLDGGASPDTTAYVEEIYLINRKVSEEREVVAFELSTGVDFQNALIPGRRMLNNFCSWDYKGVADGDPEQGCIWGSGVWTGPASTNFYDENDSVVPTSANDACSKKLSGCKIRFGDTTILPIGLFPSLRQQR